MRPRVTNHFFWRAAQPRCDHACDSVRWWHGIYGWLRQCEHCNGYAMWPYLWD